VRLRGPAYLVGSGSMGFGMTDAYDCHVFLLDGGSELALIDVGAGYSTEALLANVRSDGLRPELIRHVILTHGHADHAGGSARLSKLIPGAKFYAAPVTAQHLREGDEAGVSLDVAKEAGLYPSDYVLERCEITVEVSDGDTIIVGDLECRVIETPGHCDGHISVLLERDGRRFLFAGDVIFHGGTILLQNIHDCRLDAHVASLRKLRSLQIDALLPSHLAFDLTDGQRHIEKGNEALDRLRIPNQLVSAW
jgi:hydroxyacylglutathione hydrolase